MCIYVYTFMKSSFPKHDLQTWHCHCNLDLFLLALSAFWKRALQVQIYTLSIDNANVFLIYLMGDLWCLFYTESIA